MTGCACGCALSMSVSCILTRYTDILYYIVVITSACSMQTQWVHLDIAGPCWDDKAGGATGFGALTLAEWAVAQGR